MIKDSIKVQIDPAWNAHLDKQWHDEAEHWFGKNYWGLTIPKCSESEFKAWWGEKINISHTIAITMK